MTKILLPYTTLLNYEHRRDINPTLPLDKDAWLNQKKNKLEILQSSEKPNDKKEKKNAKLSCAKAYWPIASQLLKSYNIYSSCDIIIAHRLQHF